VTDESEYNNVPLLIRYINVGVYFDTNDSFDLIGAVDKSKLLIRVYSCKIDVISCDCSFFSDHWYERKLCRHILAALLRVDNNITDRLLNIVSEWKSEVDGLCN
jgi:hypothetical protein